MLMATRQKRLLHRGIKTGIDRVAHENRPKGTQNTATLLVHRGDVTAYSAEMVGPVRAAETTRHFLLHFDHTKIPLRLVIVERSCEIGGEAKHCVLTLLKT